MLGSLLRWVRRTLSPAPRLADPNWHDALRRVRGARHLTEEERVALRGLVREFLHEKRFIAAEGFDLTEHRRMVIAIQACIPILHLGIDAYRRFQSIYVFPDAFRERGAQEWRPGQHVHTLAGLAIQGGGVALAWSESRRGFADDDDGYNPIIHEFVHQLDMINGAPDGLPDLPSGISTKDWYETFSVAFADFQARIEAGRSTRLSDYAATNPAEFFAVLSEVYFEQPDVLRAEYAEVYRLLRAFYTQSG